MPHFYFHIRSGEDTFYDPEGVDLPDLDSAKNEAARSVREMLSGIIKNNRDAPDAMIVADGKGHELASVSLMEALPKRMRR